MKSIITSFLVFYFIVLKYQPCLFSGRHQILCVYVCVYTCVLKVIIKEESIIVREQHRPSQSWLHFLYFLYISLGIMQRDN